MENKYTVVIYENFDKNKKNNQPIYLKEDADIIILTAGSKENDKIITLPFINGDYLGVTRAFLGLGSLIHSEFQKTLQEQEQEQEKK